MWAGFTRVNNISCGLLVTTPTKANQDPLNYLKLLLLQIQLPQVFADDVLVNMAVNIVAAYQPFSLLVYHIKVYLFAFGGDLRIEFLVYF